MAHAIALPSGRGPIARLSRALAEYQHARTLHDRLSALSDRELADLGITRLNIGEIVRAAAHGRRRGPHDA